jgi:hypothetical protein
MENRIMLTALLFGVAAIIVLQVLAFHGPTPEETMRAIRCAEKARVAAETDGPVAFVRCDDMGVTP